MKTKIFVIELPTLDDVVEKIGEAIFDVFEDETPCCDERGSFSPPKPLSPSRTRCPEWNIRGTRADENKRFGASFSVDEPVWDGCESRGSFLEKRKAFDDFVTAGEHCENLGMLHDEKNHVTKCQAIRKPIGCPPVMNKDLIGESQFPWWEMGCTW